RRAFVVVGGDEDLRQAVAGDVVGLHAHAAHRLALPGRGGAAEHAAGLELEATQVAVVVIWHLVVADEDVDLAVAVEVEEQDAESLVLGFEAGLLADVGESAVAVVAEQHARVAAELARSARVADVRLARLVAAPRVILDVEMDVAADEQVGQAVAVEVAEGAASTPAVERDAGLLGDLAEAPAALAVRLIVVQVAVT